MKNQTINDLISEVGLNSKDLYVTVHRFDGERLLTAYSSYLVPEPLGTWQPLDKGIVGRAATRAEPVHVRDLSAENDYFGIYHSVQSELAIPLFQNGFIIAVVNFESTAADAFNNWEDSIFSCVANELGKFFELENVPGSKELFIPTSRLVGPKSPNDCIIARK